MNYVFQLGDFAVRRVLFWWPSVHEDDDDVWLVQRSPENGGVCESDPPG